MFKRITVIVMTVFIISTAVVALGWQSTPSLELYSSSSVTTVYRMSQDLGGKWNHYTSLRRAWSQESIKSPINSVIGGLLSQDSIILPSNQGFKVAAKKFTVSSKWGSRNSQLILEGVYGNIKVYLNGIDELSYLGEADGVGDSHRFDLSPTRLDFSKENTLFILMSEGVVHESKLLGRIWPEQGRLTGQVRIEGIPETSIEVEKTIASYDFAKQQLTVQTTFRNSSFDEPKPLVLQGVIKDKGEKAAECLLPLSSNESSQMVNLIFDLPDIRLWSIEQPYQYELELILSNNRGEFDNVHMPIAVRDVTSSPQKWSINEQEVNVNAQILTQNQEYLIRNQLQIEDWLKELKLKGCNVLYFTGFVPDQTWLYAADKIGVGIWLELPLYYSPDSRTVKTSVYEEIIAMAKRHPSVLAWTSAIGTETGSKTKDMMLILHNKMAPLPVYYMSVPGINQAIDPSQGYELGLTDSGFSGSWGKAVFADKPSIIETKSWLHEKTAAIIWLIWLLLVTFEILRNKWISYREVINDNPKRSYRIAFFWNCLAIISRLATLGALLTSLIYHLPGELPPWLPYDLSILHSVKLQNPLLIWLSLNMLLILLRILQVGVAAPSYPNSPSALALACWLEKRYRWNILLGIAWVVTLLKLPYYFPWYIPILMYVVLTLFYLPIRIRDTIKVGGNIMTMAIVPGTILLSVLVAIIWNWTDVLYFSKIIAALLKNIDFTMMV